MDVATRVTKIYLMIYSLREVQSAAAFNFTTPITCTINFICLCT